jgi:hypothetical protein
MSLQTPATAAGWTEVGAKPLVPPPRDAPQGESAQLHGAVVGPVVLNMSFIPFPGLKHGNA